MRWDRPWKVPIQSASAGMESRLSMRPRISAAALLVKVTAMRPCGETPCSRISQAARCVSTRVLPLPAPASTSTGPIGADTAARCASFSDSRRSWADMGPRILLGREGDAHLHIRKGCVAFTNMKVRVPFASRPLFAGELDEGEHERDDDG